MPVYTYRCSNCGVEFDHQQKFNERNLTRCPECGKNKLNRVYRPVGVVFKGSGFYVTDNRSKTSSSIPPTTKEKETSKTEKSKEQGTEKASEKSSSEPKDAKND